MDGYPDAWNPGRYADRQHDGFRPLGCCLTAGFRVLAAGATASGGRVANYGATVPNYTNPISGPERRRPLSTELGKTSRVYRWSNLTVALI
jgi:hypothetical protein